jgi:hypothetical protein
MKNKKILVLAALLSMIVAGGLWAQSTGPDESGNVSPTNTATSGRYKTAIDDYISPQDYAGLKLNNWFAYASFASPTTPRFGFAKQINDLYLALYYSGNFWGGLNDWKSEDVKGNGNFYNGEDKDITIYTKPTSFSNPDNSVALLLGVSGMGFRLAFSSTYDSFKKKEDIAINTNSPGNFYKSYAWENGNLVPQLKWGMAKDLIKQGIRPYVTATLNFQRDNVKGEKYTAKDKTTGEIFESSKNYFEPTIALGMGGFAFYNENGFKGSADLDYTLKLKTYNNSYSYNPDMAVGDKFDTKTFKGTWDGSTFAEKSYVSNSIVPSVSASWSAGNLGLKAKLRTTLDFATDKSTAVVLKYDTAGTKTEGTLQKTGPDVTTDTFTFTPRLDLGLQYKIVPNRLALNAGGRITREIKATTTDTKVFANDTETTKSATTKKETSFGIMTNRLYAGVQFNFSDNAWVEGVTGVNNGVNVFDTGITTAPTGASITTSGGNGLFNFTALAFGFKF